MQPLELHKPLNGAANRALQLEIDFAFRSISQFPLNPKSAVHNFRKHCKKSRAILRLIRPAISQQQYQAINITIRDCARQVASNRDQDVNLELAHEIATHFIDKNTKFFPENALSNQSLANLLATQSLPADSLATNPTNQEKKIKKITSSLKHLRQQFNEKPLPPASTKHCIEGAFKIYQKCRNSWQNAHQSKSTYDLHEWRKPCKYLRFQLYLLRNLNPPMLTAQHIEAKALTKLLGRHHDLAEFRQQLKPSTHPQRHKHLATLQALHKFIAAQQQQLENEILLRGRSFCAEPPATFKSRLQSYADA